MVLLATLDAVLCVLVGAVACAWLVVQPNARRPYVCALGAASFLWASSFVPVLAESKDWLHLFWMVQVPMMGLFMLSGVLLFTPWRGDGASSAMREGIALEKLVSSRNSPWWFLAMMASLGMAPLFLIALSGDPPEGRNIGAPIRRLFELAHWGLGGRLPDYLESVNSDHQARAIGYLPREVTVPMGSLLIASWLWICFCALALIGRCMPSPGIRRGFLLLSPLLLAALSLVAAIRESGSSAWFDPRFFWAGRSEHSGIWTSEPIVMRSFGPVLLTAVLFAILLAILGRRTPQVQ